MADFFAPAPTAGPARMHAIGTCSYGDESLGTVCLAGEAYGECLCGTGVVTEVLDANGAAQIVCSTDLT